MSLDFPASPILNQIFNSPPQEWLWDGAKWTALNSQGSLILYLPLTGGELSGPGNLIIDGTLNTRGAVTLGAGLTVTGAAAFQALTANTPATSDNSINVATTAYVQNQGYGTTSWVNGTFLPLAGGTITGSLTTNGTLTSNGALSIYGGQFNSSLANGWLYFTGSLRAYNFQSTNDVNAFGSLYCGNGAARWYWDGYMHTGQTLRCGDFFSDGNVNTNGVLYCGNGATYWQYNGGWMWTGTALQTNARFYAGSEVSAGNAVHVGGDNSGTYWQYNGGWMYTPNSILTGGNINTHEIQLNGNNIDGGAVFYSNGTAWGGYGAQYNWTGNGNWTAFQLSDLLYTYNNQGFAGGVYWTYCDERMKWNFEPVSRDCLAAVNAIELQAFDFSEGWPKQRRTNPKETRPEFFRYEHLPRKVKHIRTGFIAQQLREIIPEAVPDPPEPDAFLSVDLRPLVATLIGAIQQLSAEVQALKEDRHDQLH